MRGTGRPAQLERRFLPDSAGRATRGRNSIPQGGGDDAMVTPLGRASAPTCRLPPRRGDWRSPRKVLSQFRSRARPRVHPHAQSGVLAIPMLLSESAPPLEVQEQVPRRQWAHRSTRRSCSWRESSLQSASGRAPSLTTNKKPRRAGLLAKRIAGVNCRWPCGAGAARQREGQRQAGPTYSTPARTPPAEDRRCCCCYCCCRSTAACQRHRARDETTNLAKLGSRLIPTNRRCPAGTPPTWVPLRL